MISMEPWPEKLSRKDAARLELDASVRNFFLNEDLIAAHLLAWAALDVISDVGKARGVRTLRKMMSEKADENTRKAWSKAERDHYNFMKHADRDPDRTVRLLPDMTTFAMYTACRDYLAVFGDNTSSMAIFMGWFLNRNSSMAASFDEEYQRVVTDFGVTEEGAWTEARVLLEFALQHPELNLPQA